MALITCTECGKEFSDKAAACPNCGCPTECVLHEMNQTQKADEVIKCPYCGSESIDDDGYCNDCGLKVLNKKTESNQTESNFYMECPKCGTYNPPGTIHCACCKYRFTQKEIEANQVKEEFNGMYRYSLFGKKIEVRCPRCKSEDCSPYQEQKIIPGKTKTRYTLNLNPLKPFTVLNKKEKVIRRDRVVTDEKYVSNKCGKIF